ncbi:hypothetical protein N9U27_03825 [Candidatus Pelagibacter sp.]|nr:hypothetical protein [Candidatus Pelagibacter sp.]|tara:strand:+ start:743 stop:1192 length:450 start_codon:yes stop_codon:yes gene_type:complete
MKKTLVILLFFLIGCGYQPVYLNKSIQNLEYSKIILTGNNEINRKITSILSIKENIKDQSKNKLYINSSQKVETTSKNNAGQSLSFRTTINVDIKIENPNGEILQSKNFTKEFTYNNKKNKFELVEYQRSIKNDLITKVINEISIYLGS